ncbi:MAG: DUF1573 domain-containing protein [Planctomycetes bacterium]|nr:DUF1573 domain-containing protein [Planctomycetota bacterium]
MFPGATRPRAAARRRRVFPAVTPALLALGLAVAAEPPPQAPRYGPPPLPRTSVPAIHIAAREFDWGTIARGSVFYHTFEIENRGDAALQIRRVRPSCGCSTVTWDEEIAPGGRGVLTLSVDTSKLLGRIRKTATIESNDPARPELEVGLGGDVVTIIRWEPSDPHLSVLAGNPASLDLFLFPNTVASFQIEKIVARFGNVQAGAPIALEPGTKYRLPLEMPASERPGKKREILEVSVLTPEGERKTVEIELALEHRDVVAFAPANRFTFTRAETDPLYSAPDRPVTKSVTLAATADGGNFQVLSYTLEGLPLDLFEVAVETVQSGREYRIHLTLKRAYFGTKRLLSGKLIVTTDLPRYAVRSLLVHARFVPPVGASPGK